MRRTEAALDRWRHPGEYPQQRAYRRYKATLREPSIEHLLAGVASAADEAAQAIAGMVPALVPLQMHAQRLLVARLNAAPWYRHWRHRWRLRSMRRWS